MRLKHDIGDFQFLTGKESYDYEAPVSSHFNLVVHSDDQVKIYATTEKGELFPLFVGMVFHLDEVIQGATGLVIQANKKTNLAVKAHYRPNGDVLDTTPVEVLLEANQEDASQLAIRRIIEAELVRRGLTKEEAVDMIEDFSFDYDGLDEDFGPGFMETDPQPGGEFSDLEEQPQREAPSDPPAADPAAPERPT